MRQSRTITVAKIRVEADDLVIALIDRLIKNESSLRVIREELKDHMEMIAELQPKMNGDGSVSFNAMKISGDDVEEKIVSFLPIATTTAEAV